MKRLLALLPFISGVAFAGIVNIDPGQSGAVVVSATAATPTQLFTSDSAASKTCVVNVSTNPVYVVGFSTTSYKQQGINATFSVSTSSGSFYLPPVASAGVAGAPFCFDGPDNAFTGPLWAVAATGGNIVIKIRNH